MQLILIPLVKFNLPHKIEEILELEGKLEGELRRNFDTNVVVVVVVVVVETNFFGFISILCQA
jgi:hypothetical protein